MRRIAIFCCVVSSAVAAPDGAAIYREQCASCHGANGEGVADEYDEPLYGRKSVAALAKYIDREMPEDEPEKCVAADAQAVAEWMHGAFYSPEARAKLNPPRIELARLTNEQYRQSVADLIGSFGGRPGRFEGGGLQARYFNAEKMNREHEKLAERVDSKIQVDTAAMEGIPNLKRDSFSVTWTGALFVPETGDYGFRVITQNGARVYLNARPGGKGREEVATIDGWVSRGDEPRTEEARIPLVGGRPYPLRIQYLSYGQKSASFRFEWKPPGGVWDAVPAELLSKSWVPPVAVVATAFPPDDASYGYERGTSVSREWHDAVVRAAAEMASGLMPVIDQVIGKNKDGLDRANQLREFCLRFAERAYRRPLDEGSKQSLLKEFDGIDPEVATRRVIVRVLCSPRFLYPSLGGQAGDDFSVAANLALVMWDSLPDEELRKAAADGKLRSHGEVEAQARRMLDDPRARHKLRGFFHHWLAFGEADRLAKDPQAYPGFDERLVADLRGSLERFVDEIVWSEGSDYRGLLLADFLFMNRRMGEYYGTAVPEGDGFVKVALPPDQRSGVFTHPYLLASLSYHKSTSPIHRGVFVTRNVLGRFLKPPPMAIEFMDDRFDPSLTMREKVTQLTSKSSCMACHEMINPLGFSLENYDATGRWRDKDSGKPVDPVSDYKTSEGEVIRLSGARDLAKHAAQSPEASEAFARQLFQHMVKQAPDAYGPGTLTRLHGEFTTDHHHIRNLLLRIATTAAMHDSKPATASR
jgi:nitrate/TMAO reductase-like tetraheme cytochrome c subunit